MDNLRLWLLQTLAMAAPGNDGSEHDQIQSSSPSDW